MPQQRAMPTDNVTDQANDSSSSASYQDQSTATNYDLALAYLILSGDVFCRYSANKMKHGCAAGLDVMCSLVEQALGGHRDGDRDALGSYVSAPRRFIVVELVVRDARAGLLVFFFNLWPPHGHLPSSPPGAVAA